MILLDADVLIAFFRELEPEILTFIKRRDGGSAVRAAWERIKEADIEILELGEQLEHIVSITEKYDWLSFGDASNVTLMNHLGIRKLLSFDSDFDTVSSVERIF